MTHFKHYDEFLNEDGEFATVSNTPGMGNATPPTSTSTGSGDTWPSLGVFTALGTNWYGKRRRKKKKKKLFKK